jgi:UDP-N-acetyl-D-glucosamine dehydrogenase
VFGVSYKPGVGDVRESPALKILELLKDLGAELCYHDPHVATLPEFALQSMPVGEALSGTDLALIVTAHPGVDYRQVALEAPITVDLRGVTRANDVGNVVRL